MLVLDERGITARSETGSLTLDTNEKRKGEIKRLMEESRVELQPLDNKA